jgi:hypothetical protein
VDVSSSAVLKGGTSASALPLKPKYRYVLRLAFLASRGCYHKERA